jgi:hypothetical protein
MSTDFTDDGTIVVSAGDLEFFRASSSALELLQAKLGYEYDEHLTTVERLRREIDQRRSECQALVDVLARKYVQRPGKYDFRPEVGAFVRVGEKT